MPFVVLVAALPLAAGCLGGLSGDPSPDPVRFELATTDGLTVTAADYLGRVLVLDLMATWCAPCRAEMPHLAEFIAATGPRGVALLSLDVDPTDKTDNNDPLPRFKAEFNASWPFAYDDGLSVWRQSGARIIPTLVVVDTDGVIRDRITTYPIEADALAERVAPYLPGAA